MATLASRDTTGTFAVRKREGELRECVEKRTRAFKVFALPPAPDGRERYRVGGQIGPVHYRLDPDREAEEWKEIDLALVAQASGPWDWACVTNGYQVHIAQRLRLTGQEVLYAAQFRRLGSWLRMAPVELCWENAAGERQTIGRPVAGIEPVFDEEADTCTWRDCFGEGLDFAYNLRPDHFYKTVVVREAGALPEPTIGREGLRLTVVLALAWSRDAGPEGFAVGRRVEKLDPAADPFGAADEEVADPGKYAHRRSGDGRDAFWVRAPEAWDSWQPGEEEEAEAEEVPHRWALSTRLRRRGAQVFAALSLDAAALKGAVFPMFLDEDIAEEQVGAGTDDASTNTSTSNWATHYSAYYWNTYTALRYVGYRFTTVPIPKGATIDAASIGPYVYSTTYDDPYYTLYGNDEDSALTFAVEDDTPDGRVKTAHTVSDNQTGVGAGWGYATPNANAVVQDIVDREGWASGNDMAFIIYGGMTGTSRMYAVSYEGAPSRPATFNCSYTAAAAGVPMREFMRGIRERHGQQRYGRFF